MSQTSENSQDAEVSQNSMISEERMMKEALSEAYNGYDMDEVPVGCVIVHDGVIIAQAHNEVISEGNPTAHAELLAIQDALLYLYEKMLDEQAVKNGESNQDECDAQLQKNLIPYLDECEMFVTLEPCAMCAGALSRARIKKVHIAAMDEKAGFVGSLENLATDPRLNHTFEVETGVCEKESRELLQKFFSEKR